MIIVSPKVMVINFVTKINNDTALIDFESEVVILIKLVRMSNVKLKAAKGLNCIFHTFIIHCQQLIYYESNTQ
jgi:hypothetical protein